MPLYKISQSVNNNYDTYAAAVVCAVSEDEARLIHPGGHSDKWDDSSIGVPRAFGSPNYYWLETWASPKNVHVEIIGDETKGIEHGEVICADFKAG